MPRRSKIQCITVLSSHSSTLSSAVLEVDVHTHLASHNWQYHTSTDVCQWRCQWIFESVMCLMDDTDVPLGEHRCVKIMLD